MTLAAADLAGRTGKILQRFPSFMRAPSPDKVLAAVAAALGHDLDEAERQATRIQRAHRLGVADEAADVLGLAALLDLHAADFFLLASLSERGYFAEQVVAEAGDVPLADQGREERAYGRHVDELRDSVGRVADVLMEGAGTIWALLEGTAVLLDADRLGADGTPDASARLIEHLDAGLPHGGFVHRIQVRFHALQHDRTVELDGPVYLVENPIVDRTTDDAPRRQDEGFTVTRGGFFDGPVSVQVTGAGGRTVHPRVVDETAHTGFGWNGVLEDGQKLVLTTDGHVLLDGTDVTADAYVFTGALVGGGPFPGSTVEGAAPEDALVRVQPEHAMDRAFPRPTVTPSETLPALTLPLGHTVWRFSVEEGAFDASAFDQAVWELPTDPTALAALPPSGRVQLTWRENEPFAASVLIPAELKSLEDGHLVDGDLPTLVRAGLERFRTAGVRLDVRYFDRDWILGSSVLKDLDAPRGLGVDFDATVPPPTPDPS